MRELERTWSAHQSAPLRRTDFPRMPWGTIALCLGAPLVAVLILGAWRWWRRRPSRLALADELAGFSMVSPWLFGFLGFALFPIMLSLLLAFTKWNGIVTLDHAQWVDLDNLKHQLFYDQRFRNSIRATVYYALLAVPLGQLVALGAAMLMNHEVRGIGFFRAAWYLPSVLAGVGVAVLWRWVFDSQSGLLNVALNPLLMPFGLKPPDWFGNDAPVWAVPAFALMSIWMIGGPMMIYLAGLKGVPPELREAAAIDGAGWFDRLWNVTLPMLSPVIFFNVVMAIIGSFQVFVQSYVMTGGGPGDATRFFVLYIYNQAFDFHEMGYASMMAWLLLLIVLALTLLVMRGSRRFVYYEGLQA